MIFFLFWAVSFVSFLFMTCNHLFFFILSYLICILIVYAMKSLISYFELSHMYLFCLWQAIIDFFILSCLICIFIVNDIFKWHLISIFFLFWAFSSVSSCLCHVIIDFFYILSCPICIFIVYDMQLLIFYSLSCLICISIACGMQLLVFFILSCFIDILIVYDMQLMIFYLSCFICILIVFSCNY